jgi:pimeloyl-ACP methyl ester carboxylesterase
MRTLVIVHGAFGGGWEWTAVAELLRAEGMLVFTPTLAGLGDRAHDGSGTVGLGTHVADIIAVLDMEDLHDAASYGGVPVTAAAAQVAHRLAGIVYLDALVPRDREAAADLLPDRFAEEFRDGLRLAGPAHRVPVPAAILPPVGSVPEDVRLRYVARLRPQPVLTFTEMAKVVPTTVRTTFVRSTGSNLGQGPDDPITAMARRARQGGWDYREIEATHDPHLSNPAAVVDLLRGLAG